MKKQSTRRLVFAGLCTALGVVLPQAFHTVPNAGGIFLPMHIPVLLCGFLCGGWYGLGCGLLAPLLSSLLAGMPPAARLPGMMVELAVYGLVCGALFGVLHTKSRLANIYLALVGAMLAGRAAAGLANALLFMAGSYSLQSWVSASFVTALPGIAVQLTVLPALVFGLQKAGFVPDARPLSPRD